MGQLHCLRISADPSWFTTIILNITSSIFLHILSNGTSAWSRGDARLDNNTRSEGALGSGTGLTCSKTVVVRPHFLKELAWKSTALEKSGFMPWALRIILPESQNFREEVQGLNRKIWFRVESSAMHRVPRWAGPSVFTRSMTPEVPRSFASY